MPSFSVDESIEIKVPASKVRESLLDFRQWVIWSPWICAEPDCRVNYSDDGKSYDWDGKIIGSGGMKLRNSEEQQLTYALEFLKPFKSKADVDFQILPQGDDRTKLHWRMQSSLPFFLFFMAKKMSAMIGADYRRGLAKLKDHLEQGKIPSELKFLGVDAGFHAAYVGTKQTSSLDEIGPVMERQLERLTKLLEEKGLAQEGAPFTISHHMDVVQNRLSYTIALPVKSPVAGLSGDFVSGTYQVAKSYQIEHRGAYRHLANAWASGMMRARADVFKSAKGQDCCEVYSRASPDIPESDWVTQIHLPAR